MRLITGGAYQGKRTYAASRWLLAANEIQDCAEWNVEDFSQAVCVYRFHLWIKAQAAAERDIHAQIEEIVKTNPDIIIIVDEVGSGIVPMDPSERQWREAVGRAACFLAERAESVERVVCGYGVKIK